MTEPIVFSLIILFLFGVVFYIRYLRRQLTDQQERMAFYSRISSAIDLLSVTYDVRQDRLSLSHDCAQMLGLPEEIEKFSEKHQEALADKENPLYPVAVCIGAYQEEKAWLFYRRGQSPRHFLLRSYAMKDIEGHPSFIVGLFRDVTKQSNEAARLAVKAQFDGLTHVHNSGATRSWMQENVGLKPGGMLFLLDVDHFKGVNDTIGHQGGDQALVCVANALRQAFGGQGFIGRLGGDEFTAYLDRADRQQAESIAQAIHAHTTRLGQEAGLAVELTVSIGCALLTDEHYAAAYQRADQALYMAKEQGRNTHVILPPEGERPESDQ